MTLQANFKDEYFVVGKTLNLQGEIQTSHLKGFTLEVWHNKRKIGRAGAMLNKQDNRLHLFADLPEGMGEDYRIEAKRLIARVASRFALHKNELLLTTRSKDSTLIDSLYRDGFRKSSEGVFIRPPGKFLIPAEEKEQSMESVYQDPYTIPWNFVPIEKDLLQYILADESIIPNKSRILEIGCGYGKNSQFLMKLGYDISGIEISHSAIKRSHDFLDNWSEFRQASTTDLPYEENTFDAVIDVGCLHCMPEKERKIGLSEISRVLRPKGKLYSRMFKPMPSGWLSEQPFSAPKFGLLKEDFLKLFAPNFHFEIISESDFAHYVRAYNNV